MVMRTHVCQTVSRCFAALRQLRSIRHLVSATVFQSLVTALVLSWLDYGNGMLVGLPSHLIRRLQSVQNAAARLIFRLRRSDWQPAVIKSDGSTCSGDEAVLNRWCEHYEQALNHPSGTPCPELDVASMANTNIDSEVCTDEPTLERFAEL